MVMWEGNCVAVDMNGENFNQYQEAIFDQMQMSMKSSRNVWFRMR